MWEEILKLAISNGLWAVLFVGLLIFQLKDSNAREKKYQATINKLNEHLTVVNDLKNDINDIKEVILIKNKRSTKNEKSKEKSEELQVLG